MAASSSPSSDVAKKPQPIPWTHEETLNLIRAYQDKWYSLKRGPLKASQWDELALTISSKTGTQCRHKIEKMRKRYRSEKHNNNPNSSSLAWPYFHLMDQMDQGPLPLATPNRHHHDYDLQISKRTKFHPSNPTFDVPHRFSSCSNPISINSRFHSRRVPYGMVQQQEEFQVEQDDHDEEERSFGGGSIDMMGELAVQMKEFSENFMRMERKKMEAMRETQRYRMEMENKRMQMILVAQQKTIDMISTAFATAAAAASSSSPSHNMD